MKFNNKMSEIGSPVFWYGGKWDFAICKIFFLCVKNNLQKLSLHPAHATASALP